MRAALALAALLAAGAASAQEIAGAPGGVVRALDKVSGETVDIDIGRGQAMQIWRLTIQIDECRYRTADPSAEAWAHLTIRDSLLPDPVFSGWMIASSPGLSAMDHARYDVWVLHCSTDSASGR